MKSGSIALLLMLLAGCSSSPTAQPTGTPPSPTPTAAAASEPAASEPVATQPGATPTVYIEVQKNAEGAHGGPRPIDLPSDVVLDYSVQGTCTFVASFQSPDMTPAGQSMSIKVDGATSGSWEVQLTPGSYVVQLGEAVGCTFHVTVRAPS